ncbi:MAG: hypothetical protein PWR01_3578 [Clostridiales bacterium]|jgi:Ni/Co efflux regulator RcnB|nr:hypothetical protein [Clostridiales bacterium]MDN5282505.1 hypothetical protein [Candidatus Ozemobacter sp.]
MKRSLLLLVMVSSVTAGQAQPANRGDLQNNWGRKQQRPRIGENFRRNQNEKSGEKRQDKLLKKKLLALKDENPEKYQKLLDGFDMNKDGMLDAFEIERFKSETLIRKMIMHRFDQNRDGQLDQSENEKFEAEHQKQMQVFSQRNQQLYRQALQKCDQNGNGKLEVKEWTMAMRQGVLPTPQLGQHEQQHPEAGQHRPRPGQYQPAPGHQQPVPAHHEPMPGQQPAQGGQNQEIDDGGLLEGIELDSPELTDKPGGGNDESDLDFLDF